MTDKRKWYPVLFLGLALLLGGLVAGCAYLPAPEPPVIVAFMATPVEIGAGESATLIWNVTGATVVTIDQGIGDVPAAGVEEVSPATTTTYTLTAVGAAGSATESVVVTVAGSPLPEESVPSEETVSIPSEETAEQHYQRGVALTEKGRYEQAISEFTKAIEMDSTYSDAYSGRGRAYCRKGDCSSAIADYTQAIELDPNSAAAYCGRGIAHRKLGEVAQAIADFEKCIEVSQDTSLIQEARGEIEELRSPQ